MKQKNSLLIMLLFCVVFQDVFCNRRGYFWNAINKSGGISYRFSRDKTWELEFPVMRGHRLKSKEYIDWFVKDTCDIEIEIEPLSDVYYYGDTVKYTYTITNFSNSAQNIQLTKTVKRKKFSRRVPTLSKSFYFKHPDRYYFKKENKTIHSLQILKDTLILFPENYNKCGMMEFYLDLKSDEYTISDSAKVPLKGFEITYSPKSLELEKDEIGTIHFKLKNTTRSTINDLIAIFDSEETTIQNISGLNPGEEFNYTIDVSSNEEDNGRISIHLKNDDYIDDELYTVHYTVKGDPELYISIEGENLNFSSAVVGEPVTFNVSVFNEHGMPADSVHLSVFSDYGFRENGILHEEDFSVPGYGTYETSFTVTPAEFKFIRGFAKIDYDNGQSAYNHFNIETIAYPHDIYLDIKKDYIETNRNQFVDVVISNYGLYTDKINIYIGNDEGLDAALYADGKLVDKRMVEIQPETDSLFQLKITNETGGYGKVTLTAKSHYDHTAISGDRIYVIPHDYKIFITKKEPETSYINSSGNSSGIAFKCKAQDTENGVIKYNWYVNEILTDINDSLFYLMLGGNNELPSYTVTCEAYNPKFSRSRPTEEFDLKASHTWYIYLDAYSVDKTGWHMMSLPYVPEDSLTYNLFRYFKVLWFNETTGTWQNPYYISTAQGFILWANYWQVGTVFEPNGEILTEDITVPLTYTDNKFDPRESGWNLIGNPYFQSISFEKLLQINENSNIEPAFHILDNETNQYLIYPDPLGTVDETLPPWKGFFVRALDNTEFHFTQETDSDDDDWKNRSENKYKDKFLMNIELITDTLRDECNYLGFVSETETPENFNIQELKPISRNYAQLCFSDNKIDYSYLFKKNSKTLKHKWNMNISSTLDHPEMRIFWNYRNSEKIKNLYLIDIDKNEKINMLNHNSYKFKYIANLRRGSSSLEEGKHLFTEDKVYKKKFIIEAELNPIFADSVLDIPEVYKLYQNYPNPFNTVSHITAAVPEKSVISVNIYNVLGQRVKTICSEKEFNPGYHKFFINLEDCSSGIYILKLESDKFSDVKKMLLIK